MSKRIITFSFRPNVTRERMEELLSEISDWREVDQACHLQPESKLELLQRLSYLYVKDDAEANDVAHRLAKMPEIESASTPTPRRLI